MSQKNKNSGDSMDYNFGEIISIFPEFRLSKKPHKERNKSLFIS
jgi:hypothetical protein